MNKDKVDKCKNSLSVMLSEAKNLKANIPDFRSKVEAIIKLIEDISYRQFDNE